MVRTIAQLRDTPDDILIKEHDERALNTSVGTGYYEEELDRRSRERSAKASRELAESANNLAIRTHKLTVWTIVLSGIATLASVAAVVVSIVTLIASAGH